MSNVRTFILVAVCVGMGYIIEPIVFEFGNKDRNKITAVSEIPVVKKEKPKPMSSLPADEKQDVDTIPSSLKFSWDRVPLYAHFGVGGGLKPTEYDFLAKNFSFITLTYGKGTLEGSAETHLTMAASELRKRNKDLTLLYYWASDKPKHQAKISQQSYPGEFLIRNYKGGTKDIYLDLPRPEVQDWWASVAHKATSEYGFDGIYMDGATSGRPAGKMNRTLGSEKTAAFDKATFAMLADARKRMGQDKLVIFNPLHGYDQKHKQIGQEYLPATNGAMIDDFDRDGNQSAEYMANSIKTMTEAAEKGKIVIFKAWPGFTATYRKKNKNMNLEECRSQAQKDLLFPLACFLIGAEKYTYFCYTWGWYPQEGTFEWYPEFDQALGPPKGKAIQEGWTFRREFEHASVFVDLNTRNAKIDWR